LCPEPCAEYSPPIATLTFLGAARTVTGSKYLVEFDDSRILVDCGQFQGLKSLRERNWERFPFDPRALTSVVLTHAHIDHSGMLPRLVADGFRGRIFCTPGTADLCRIVLPDAGRLQEEDARQANRHGYSRHHPALPLFTEADAFRAVTQLQPLGYSRSILLTPRVSIEFIPAGHLLGSAYVRMRLASGREVLFGGDLGRYNRPVLPDPVSVQTADILLCESTYGDRVHEPDDRGRRLAAIINGAADRGGKLIIPAFAIGRVEEVLYWIDQLERTRQIPVLPVFVDSPMAIEALKYYRARAHELDADLRPAYGRTCAFCTERMQTVATPEESKRLTASKAPAIVISSSGMATGGRVLHHLKAALPDPQNTVLFVGFQPAGTRGRQLVDGAREVKMHGIMVPVAAHIERLDSMSAHADSEEMLRWLKDFTRPPATTYLVHGESGPMTALRAAIENRLGWNVQMPDHLERVPLD
jgi:metallo-beta-lactamase family protein